MKHLLFILLTVCATSFSQAQNYQLLTTDPMGDGISLENDAENLYYAIDYQNDSLWFKIEVFAPPIDFFCSICIDNDNNPSTGRPFYGNNTAIKCDRTINIYYGSIGFYGQVLDSQIVYTPLPYNVNVIEEDSIFECNIKLSDILEANNYDLNAIAMVGQGHIPLANDDIPDSGFLTIPLGITGIDYQDFYTDVLVDVYPNPSNGLINLSIKNLPYDNKSLDIKVLTAEGKIVKTINYNTIQTKLIIDLTEFTSNTYFILVNGQIIKKIQIVK